MQAVRYRINRQNLGQEFKPRSATRVSRKQTGKGYPGAGQVKAGSVSGSSRFRIRYN